MDPTSKKKPSTLSSLDPFSSSHLLKDPKKTPNHKSYTTSKLTDLPKLVDTRMQAKAMSKSIDFGPSISKKQLHQHPQKPTNNIHMPTTTTTTTTTTITITNSKTKSKSKTKTKTLTKTVENKIKGGKEEIQEEKEQGQEENKSGSGGDEKKLVLWEGGGRRRRRSFCGSELDMGAFLSSVGAKVVANDMAPLMQIHAMSCARKTYDGLEKFSTKALAFSLKKEFDKVYGPAWHCIVGNSFGSFVTHSIGGFIYFSMDKLHVLLFKTTVQRAE